MNDVLSKGEEVGKSEIFFSFYQLSSLAICSIIFPNIYAFYFIIRPVSQAK